MNRSKYLRVFNFKKSIQIILEIYKGRIKKLQSEKRV